MQEAERLPTTVGFGALLRHYRLAAGLSQEALAERATMSPFAISALERGHRRRPQAKTLVLLAEALRLDVDQRACFESAARASSPRTSLAIGPWSDDLVEPLVRHNLPRQVTPLIGRERELAEITRLALSHPLTTLLGPGGIGKTRLALEVGESLLEKSPDGVWLIELASFEGPSSVVRAIASALALRDNPSRSLTDVVLGYVRYRRLVLIIDNCEHIIEEAASVIDMIARNASDVRIIATSRAPLHVSAEHVHRVPSLEVPSGQAATAKEARQYSAIAMFAERAQAANSSFMLTDDAVSSVTEICTRLDGIPLAIELAAARTTVLSLSDIAQRLDQRFHVLAGERRAAIPRQQTLRALIDWSYDLLSESEKQAFRSLGVFPGGFSVEAVAALKRGGDDTVVFELLISLAEKSLIHAETLGQTTRFRLLESMRAYAHEQLTAHNELNAASAAHALAYLTVAERLESQWDATPDVPWRASAEPELENWRAALRWAFAANGDLDTGRRLVVALRPVWFTLAPSEGLGWVRAALASCKDAPPDRIKAWLELSAAHLAMVSQQYEQAVVSAQRALTYFSGIGEELGEALSRLFYGAARGMLGAVNEAESDLRAALEECRRLGTRRAVAAALLYLAALKMEAEDGDSARRLFEEALGLFRIIGAARPAAHVALNLAELEFKAGNPDEAVRLANEALEADGALSDYDAVAYDLCNLAAYEGALGRWEPCISHAHEALALARKRSIDSAAAWAIQHLAAAAALRPECDGKRRIEQRRRAAQLVGFVDSCIAKHGLHRDFTERQEREHISRAVEEVFGSGTGALISEGSTWSEAQAFEEALQV